MPVCPPAQLALPVSTITRPRSAARRLQPGVQTGAVQPGVPQQGLLHPEDPDSVPHCRLGRPGHPGDRRRHSNGRRTLRDDE